MNDLEQRAAKRKQKITLKKLDLHSIEHNSCHTHLNAKQSWELLAKLSQESWIEKTGKIPSNTVDKSIYRFIPATYKYD